MTESLAGSGSSATEPDKPTPEIEVDAWKLWKDYDANEVKADNRYKGHVTRIRGTVASIDKGPLGGVTVLLTSPNEFMFTAAKLEGSEQAAAGDLKKGQRVALVCKTVLGRVLGSPALADCTLD